MSDGARFVFSLRSPYAWIAARWVVPRLPEELAPVWRPFFPLPEFSNFPPLLESKVRYLVRDVVRLVEHYGGGPVRFPTRDDVDWTVPHLAFLEADARGRGRELAFALWEARFGRGEHLGDDAVVTAAVESVGLDAGAVMDAARDPERRETLDEQVKSDYRDEGIFGVPTLILPKGTRYWGHDRIEWALREGKLGGNS